MDLLDNKLDFLNGVYAMTQIHVLAFDKEICGNLLKQIFKIRKHALIPLIHAQNTKLEIQN